MPSIEARTQSGRFELVLPDKATFQLDATAERGEAVNDFGSPIQKESDGHSATLKGKVGEGPTIHITSSRGSISVRKEGAAAGDGAGDKAESSYQQSAFSSQLWRWPQLAGPPLMPRPGERPLSGSKPAL
jgi:hypothetical protein